MIRVIGKASHLPLHVVHCVLVAVARVFMDDDKATVLMDEPHVSFFLGVSKHRTRNMRVSMPVPV